LDEVRIWYWTALGDEKRMSFDVNETEINMDLRDISAVDLLPVVFLRDLRYFSIRDNELTQVDLSPFSNCKKLEGIRLSNNKLQTLDLTPLSDCPKLMELAIQCNEIEQVDISPLFHCPEIKEFKLDDATIPSASLLLRSVGSWPKVILDMFFKIQWEAPEPS
jgi:Leucine-rich repeat (LRR) protein